MRLINSYEFLVIFGPCYEDDMTVSCKKLRGHLSGDNIWGSIAITGV